MPCFRTFWKKKWLQNVARQLRAEETLAFLHSGKKKYERLEPLLTQQIHAWYQKMLVPDLSNDLLVPYVTKKQLPVEMQASHSGCSSGLEAAIRTTDVSQRWSDEPENIPDIERLLSGQQAFPTSTTGNNGLRPVIWQVTSDCLPDVFQGGGFQTYCSITTKSPKMTG